MFAQIGDIDAITIDYRTDICKYGIYFDTICIQEPFYVIASRVKNCPEMTLFSVNRIISFFNNLYLMYSLKDTVLQNINPLICLFVPNIGIEFGDDKFNKISKETLDLTNNYVASILEIDKFDVGKVINALKKISIEELERKLMINGFSININDEIKNLLMREELHIHKNQLMKKNLNMDKEILTYIAINSCIHKTLLCIISSEHQSEELKTCLIMKNNDWFAVTNIHKNMHNILGITEAMKVNCSFERKDISWLEKITITDLIELRQNDMLKGLRKIFRDCNNDLASRPSTDFSTISEMFFKNLYDEIENEKYRIINNENLSKKNKFYSASSAIINIFGVFSIPVGIISFIVGQGFSVPNIHDAFFSKQKDNKNPILFMADIINR